MLQLEHINAGNGPAAYDVRTKNGRYAGTISERSDGTARVFFNMTATKGSARRFPDVQAAVDYIVTRRVKKGWSV